MRKVVNYPGNRIGPGHSEYVSCPEVFFIGWDKYATTLGGLKDPSTIFLITTFDQSMMDSSLGFKLHAKVMIEEQLGPHIDKFLEKMEEWLPKKEEPAGGETKLLTEGDMKTHPGGGPAQEGDSISDHEYTWVYVRGRWVPYWNDGTEMMGLRERSGP